MTDEIAKIAAEADDRFKCPNAVWSKQQATIDQHWCRHANAYCGWAPVDLCGPAQVRAALLKGPTE